MERFNQTIQKMLVKFITSRKESWQDYLDTCVYAYNTSHHDSTRFTPFELMFGRQAVLPIDVRSDAVEAVDDVLTAVDEEMFQKMVEAYWITEDGAQEIHVYDSMYATVGTYTKKQIASIVSSSEKEIKLKMMNVQKQNGGCDCGLFAIVFPSALANGIQPGHCFFNQDTMRRHLYKCLTEGKMLMFPQKQRRTSRKSEDSIELFCICHMPEIPPMVECSQCSNWYHVSCVSVPQEALDDSSIEWICQNC